MRASTTISILVVALFLAVDVLQPIRASAQDQDGACIASGETKTGTIFPAIDIDIYTFYGQVGQGVVIAMADISSTGSLCPQLRLYDPSGVRVREPPGSLSEALDTTLDFTTGGNADWFRQTTTFYNDGDAVQSGHISDNQESSMNTTVMGPTTLSFYWRVSSEGGLDFLQFYIDGVRQRQISGSVDWQQQTYTIPSGWHILGWRYVKDGSVSSGNDCGWVDKVELTPRTAMIENFQLKMTGIYTIEASNACGLGTGEYALSFVLAPGATTSAQDIDGGLIASGEAKTGQISPRGDTDAYTFYGRAGQGIVIVMGDNSTSGNLSPRLQLYDPNGVRVAGPPVVSNITRIENYRLNMTGIYTIVASNGYGVNTGEYALSLSLVPPKDPYGLYPYDPLPPDGSSVSLCDWDTLSWWPVDGAMGYDVYFAPGPCMPLEKVAENIADPCVPRPAIENNHQVCYWRVTAHTPDGDIQGPTWWFGVECCFPKDFSTFNDWVDLGKPDCWCSGYKYQCDGDADGKDSGGVNKYRVFTGDLNLIIKCWKKKPGEPDCACADIDHKDSGGINKYRVFVKDLNILVANWKKKDTDLPGNCPRPE